METAAAFFGALMRGAWTLMSQPWPHTSFTYGQVYIGIFLIGFFLNLLASLGLTGRGAVRQAARSARKHKTSPERKGDEK